MIDFARLSQALRAGRIGRRDCMRLLAAAGFALTATGGARSARAKDSATVFTWAGYDDPALYPTYVEKHGGPPEFALWTDEEDGLLKLLGGFQADVVVPCSYKVARW